MLYTYSTMLLLRGFDSKVGGFYGSPTEDTFNRHLKT